MTAREEKRLRLAESTCRKFRAVVTMRVVDQTPELWSDVLQELGRWLAVAPKEKG